MYGNDETPLVSSLRYDKSMAITHRHREATRRAAAANTNNEMASAKAAVSLTPAPVTNTNQILKGTIGVSGSAIAEAANGIYGTDIINEVSWQLEQEIVGIFKDLENVMLFGVESTSDPRQMKGLIGAVGTYNGFIQTERKNGSAAALDQTMFDALLGEIWVQQAGRYPDTILCSLQAAKLINVWSAPQFQVQISVDQLANLTAGQRVIRYIAPWGGLLDIVPHPLCANVATAANNWLAAIRKDLLAIAPLRPLHTRPIPSDVDGQLFEVLIETTLDERVEKAHGILRNFAQLS
jgi:hypothetical protein